MQGGLAFLAVAPKPPPLMQKCSQREPPIPFIHHLHFSVPSLRTHTRLVLFPPFSPRPHPHHHRLFVSLSCSFFTSLCPVPLRSTVSGYRLRPGFFHCSPRLHSNPPLLLTPRYDTTVSPQYIPRLVLERPFHISPLPSFPSSLSSSFFVCLLCVSPISGSTLVLPVFLTTAPSTAWKPSAKSTRNDEYLPLFPNPLRAWQIRGYLMSS